MFRLSLLPEELKTCPDGKDISLQKKNNLTMDAHAQVIVFNFLYIEYIRRRNSVPKRHYPERKAAVLLPEVQQGVPPLPEQFPSQGPRPELPS